MWSAAAIWEHSLSLSLSPSLSFTLSLLFFAFGSPGGFLWWMFVNMQEREVWAAAQALSGMARRGSALSPGAAGKQREERKEEGGGSLTISRTLSWTCCCLWRCNLCSGQVEGSASGSRKPQLEQVWVCVCVETRDAHVVHHSCEDTHIQKVDKHKQQKNKTFLQNL